MTSVRHTSWVLAVSLLGACAGKKDPVASQPIVEKRGAANAEATQVQPTLTPEQPLWTVDTLPLKNTCQPPAGLGFKLSEGLSSTNQYLLARFAMLGPAPLKFDATFLNEFFGKAGFSGVTLVEDQQKGVQGIVASSEKINLVVFRGTHSIAGVKTDISLFTSLGTITSLPGGVHAGFKSAFDSVKPKLDSLLSTAANKTKPTFFVGHSLGGALAVLAAKDAQAQGVNVSGVVTLGQPRVGNMDFASGVSSTFGKKLIRFVYANDPVPHLPPASGAIQEAAVAISTNEIVRLGIQSAAILNFAHADRSENLGTASFLSTDVSTDSNWDKAYWQSNGAKITQSLSALTSLDGATAIGAVTQNNVVADHDVEKYLCGVLERVK